MLGVSDKRDWKENLSVEAEKELNEILESVKKHRCAYKSADNVQVAQLWCATIELKRLINKLDMRLEYIENILNKLFRGYDEEKDKLVKSLLKF
ncbi:MAG: hypothetical protein B6U88_02360 [Candidatus Aenigmarchaeota archaeon ex4484_56]|nr:MAG: hypothetical protein B6U88_02360 [Candidatus Aenigmarchaeota archaeon ex4484_56]